MDGFDNAVAEAEDFLSEARQQKTDGDPDEAEVSVLAAVMTLERLLSPPEGERG